MDIPLELYDKFKITIYTIGSTKYKQEDCSLMLTQVYIKTWQDKRYRQIKDFFGETAQIDAQRFCLEMVNN